MSNKCNDSSCAKFVVAVALRWIVGLMLATGCLVAQAAPTEAAPQDTATQNAARPDAKRSAIRFNHITTGFSLTGAHAQASCESCHVQGVFLGTPRECNFCHLPGNRMGARVMPTNHIPTTESCANCHRTIAWIPATFRHGGVAVGSCSTCHNGSKAKGKPGNHVPTTRNCDDCHRTTVWTPASFRHISVTTAACSTCHNGTTAPGKPANHVPTTSVDAFGGCELCHRTTGWLPTSFNHAKANIFQGSGTCAQCHNGTIAQGKTNTLTHNSTTASCDACHRITAWTPAGNHADNVAGQCDNCHGVWAVGPSANHIPYKTGLANGTSMKCDACHAQPTAGTTASWSVGRINHNGSQGVNAGSGSCKTCHLRGTPYTVSFGLDKKDMHEGGGDQSDCSQSACHKPLGRRGTTYINWD